MPGSITQDIVEIKEFKRGLLSSDFNTDRETIADGGLWQEATVGAGNISWATSEVLMYAPGAGDNAERFTGPLPHSVGTITKGIFSFEFLPTPGLVAQIGFFDATDGVFMEINGDEARYYFVTRKLGVDSKVPMEEFNLRGIPPEAYPYPFVSLVNPLQPVGASAVIEYGYGSTTTLSFVDPETKFVLGSHATLFAGDDSPSKAALPLCYNLIGTAPNAGVLKHTYTGIFTTDSAPDGYPLPIQIDVSSGPVSVVVPPGGDPLQVEFPSDFEVAIDTSTPLDVNVLGTVAVAEPVSVDGNVGISGTVAIDDTTPIDVNVSGTVDVSIPPGEPLEVTITGDVGIDDTTPIDVNISSTGGIAPCSPTTLGGGLITPTGGLLSSYITIPAGTESVTLSTRWKFSVTTNGATPEVNGDVGYLGDSSNNSGTMVFNGSSVINGLKIASQTGKGVWVEFFSCPGAFGLGKA